MLLDYLRPTVGLWQVGQARKLFVSVYTPSQSFLLACRLGRSCFIFFLKAKSNADSYRDGGLNKHTQAFKLITLSPICNAIVVIGSDPQGQPRSITFELRYRLDRLLSFNRTDCISIAFRSKLFTSLNSAWVKAICTSLFESLPA